MASLIKSLRTAGLSVCAILLTLGLALCAQHAYLYGQDKSGFPDGRDAVQAAAGSHKVVFENAFIRTVYVTLPPAGSSEPMHTHRWPSVFLRYEFVLDHPHVASRFLSLPCVCSRTLRSR